MPNTQSLGPEATPIMASGGLADFFPQPNTPTAIYADVPGIQQMLSRDVKFGACRNVFQCIDCRVAVKELNLSYYFW